MSTTSLAQIEETVVTTADARPFPSLPIRRAPSPSDSSSASGTTSLSGSGSRYCSPHANPLPPPGSAQPQPRTLLAVELTSSRRSQLSYQPNPFPSTMAPLSIPGNTAFAIDRLTCPPFHRDRLVGVSGCSPRPTSPRSPRMPSPPPSPIPVQSAARARTRSDRCSTWRGSAPSSCGRSFRRPSWRRG